jgi:hypothetical protein
MNHDIKFITFAAIISKLTFEKLQDVIPPNGRFPQLSSSFPQLSAALRVLHKFNKP